MGARRMEAMQQLGEALPTTDDITPEKTNETKKAQQTPETPSFIGETPPVEKKNTDDGGRPAPKKAQQTPETPRFIFETPPVATKTTDYGDGLAGPSTRQEV